MPERLGAGRLLFRAAECAESVELAKTKPAPESALTRKKRRRVNGLRVVDGVEMEVEFAPLARSEDVNRFIAREEELVRLTLGKTGRAEE